MPAAALRNHLRPYGRLPGRVTPEELRLCDGRRWIEDPRGCRVGDEGRITREPLERPLLR